jgi:hypothetical protein
MTDSTWIRSYNNKNIYTAGAVRAGTLRADNNLYASIFYDSNNTAYYADPSSTSIFNNFRANIFYDNNNTAYYVDPSGTSKFNTINLGGVSMSSWPIGGDSDWLLAGSDMYSGVSGNVGIGVTTPSGKLDVDGSLYIGNEGLYDRDDGEINIKGNLSVEGGQVGVSEVEAYDKYSLWGNSPVYSIGMYSAHTLGFLNDYATTFTMNPDNDRGWVWRDSADGTADGAMSLTTEGKLYVKNTAAFNGDVGIGTTSPGTKLDVVGDARANRFYDRNNTSYYLDPASTSYLNDLRINIFYDRNDSNYRVDPNMTSYFNDLRANIFYDRQNTAYYVDPNSTSSFNNLRANIFYDRQNTGYYVDPAATSNLNILNSTNSYVERYYDRNNTSYYVDPASTSYLNDLRTNIFYDRQNTAYYLDPNGSISLTVAGSVGIGTTSPTYPLHMGSGAHVTTGGVWTNASSKEYKDNIQNLTIEEATAALMDLTPVKFTYKADNSDEYVGFIAENVPELVATKGRKGLSPMDIVALLTKVVQKQQEEIEELKAQLNKKK